MLVFSTSSPLSNSFAAYAADNCDATSTCNNTPGLDSQINNCNLGSQSANGAAGNSIIATLALYVPVLLKATPII